MSTASAIAWREYRVARQLVRRPVVIVGVALITISLAWLFARANASTDDSRHAAGVVEAVAVIVVVAFGGIGAAPVRILPADAFWVTRSPSRLRLVLALQRLRHALIVMLEFAAVCAGSLLFGSQRPLWASAVTMLAFIGLQLLTQELEFFLYISLYGRKLAPLWRGLAVAIMVAWLILAVKNVLHLGIGLDAISRLVSGTPAFSTLLVLLFVLLAASAGLALELSVAPRWTESIYAAGALVDPTINQPSPAATKHAPARSWEGGSSLVSRRAALYLRFADYRRDIPYLVYIGAVSASACALTLSFTKIGAIGCLAMPAVIVTLFSPGARGFSMDSIMRRSVYRGTMLIYLCLVDCLPAVICGLAVLIPLTMVNGPAQRILLALPLLIALASTTNAVGSLRVLSPHTSRGQRFQAGVLRYCALGLFLAWLTSDVGWRWQAGVLVLVYVLLFAITFAFIERRLAQD